MLWKPVYIFILLEHQRLGTLDVKEPARNCPVHNTLLRAWIKRIFVANIVNLPDYTLFFEVFCNKFIIFPHLKTFVVGIGVVAIVVNNVKRLDAVTLGELEVVLAIGRRNMNNSRTRLMRHKIRSVNLMDSIVLRPSGSRR